MSRYKLELQGRKIHQLDLQVRVQDLNYGNHLANERVLSYAQEIRVDYLKQHQLSEFNLLGCGWIQCDAIINYIREAFYGEHLILNLYVDDIQSRTLDMYTCINRPLDNSIVSLVKTTLMAYDYTSARSSKFSKNFIDLINQNI